LPCILNYLLKIYPSSRCNEIIEMMAEEVTPPLLSIKEANAPDEPDADCEENQG
jgi:hypothetical protein